MRPVFLDSRGTRLEAKSRNHHINAARSCRNYHTPKQRPRHDDNVEVGYNCIVCKHRKASTLVRRLFVILAIALLVIIALSTLADALYRESVNAKHISNAYKLQYELSRVGDVK